MESGKWKIKKLKAESIKLNALEFKDSGVLTMDKWRMENGELKIENGELKMENRK